MFESLMPSSLDKQNEVFVTLLNDARNLCKIKLTCMY